MRLCPEASHDELLPDINWFSTTISLPNDAEYCPAVSMNSDGDVVQFVGYGPDAADAIGSGASSPSGKIDNDVPKKRWWPAVSAMTAGGIISGGLIGSDSSGVYRGLVSSVPQVRSSGGDGSGTIEASLK